MLVCAHVKCCLHLISVSFAVFVQKRDRFYIHCKQSKLSNSVRFSVVSNRMLPVYYIILVLFFVSKENKKKTEIIYIYCLDALDEHTYTHIQLIGNNRNFMLKYETEIISVLLYVNKMRNIRV